MNRSQAFFAHRPVLVSLLSFLTSSLPYSLTLLAISSVAWACPGCKEALFDPGGLPQRLATAKGYALSIALMLSVPLLLVATLATAVVRAQRRHKRHAD